MKPGTKAINAIVERFESKAPDVANILAGPRREGWFNAEALLAVGHMPTLFSGVAYGEQGYSNVCKDVSGKGKKWSSPRIPDIVLYGRRNTPVVIIEAKMIYRSDTPKKREKAFSDLSAQIMEAKDQCPKAICVGIVYLVVRTSDPNKKNVRQSEERFYLESKTRLDALLHARPHQWFRLPAVLRGLVGLSTTFANPQVGIWLGLGAVAL